MKPSDMEHIYGPSPLFQKLFVYSTRLSTYLRVKRLGMSLSERMTYSMVQVITEYQKWYLPTGGLKGATVMDVGAEVGCTAWFFFSQGAKKVIAIEPEPSNLKRLHANREHFDWNMEIIPRNFHVSDLYRERDFTKVNMEGWEADLVVPEPVSQHLLGKMTLVAHDGWLAERFKRLGFHDITEPDAMLGGRIMANW